MGGVASLCEFSASDDASFGAEISTAHRPDLFVDAKAKVTYEYVRSTMRLRRDGLPVAKVRKAEYDGNVIKVVRGTNGFKDDRLLRVHGPLTGRMDDWFTVSQTHGRELSREAFLNEFAGCSTVHIKGFTSGLANVYDENIVEKLKQFEVLAWDGEDYDESSFTRLVPLYLNNHSAGVAIAFKKMFEVPRFNSRWYSWMAKHPGRLLVVSVDEKEVAERMGISEEVDIYCKSPSEEEREAFLLARVALKTTGAAEVIALGGEGSAGWEAQASFPDDVHWTVYAVSRGHKEKQPSLCDFARRALTGKNSGGAHVHLVMGRDANEFDAFHREI
mmetsp:Transcript_9921/g.31498  ORF Transcript_9921/g.31498 Transcript_9921/m.31498 type:complete len:331 (+) Transcript_9921:75-1067(+)